MDIVFGIISYQRCGYVKTIDTLVRLGVSPSNIVLSTQTVDDYHKYKEAYGSQVTVIYKEGHSASDNRNNVLEYYGDNRNIVIMDDDVLDVYILHNSKLVSIGDKFLSLMEFCFNTAKKSNAPLFGVYSVCNAFYMKNTTQTKSILTGPLLGFTTNKFKLNSEYKVKEDFELCLRIMDSGYNVLRFNYLTLKRYDTPVGGCNDHWGCNEEVCNKLLRKYDKYIVRNPRRSGEVLLRRGL